MIIASLKRFISRFLTVPLIGRIVYRFRRKVIFHGVEIDLGNPYLSNHVRAAIFWNLYESAEARLIRKWLPTDKKVVELGASLGIISKLIASQICQDIICVEANQSLIPSIKYNLDSVSVRSFKIIQKAIHYSSEFVSFSWREGDNLTGKIDPTGATLVESITLSGILHEQSVQEYSLVMDIEGAEIEILKEDGKAFNYCACIIAEIHKCTYKGDTYTVEDIHAFIEGQGFQMIERDGNCFAYRRLEK